MRVVAAVLAAALVVPAGAATAQPATSAAVLTTASVSTSVLPAASTGEAEPATAGRANPRPRRMKREVWFTLRSPVGVASSVTVTGPRTVHVRLTANERVQGTLRRLPFGRYRVTALAQTGPGGPQDDWNTGGVYLPVISRSTFRLTKRTAGRTRVRVVMRRSSLLPALRATATADDRVSLAWTMPAGVRAVVRRFSGSNTVPPVVVQDGIAVSPTSLTRRTALDAGVQGSLTFAYSLFMQAGSGGWVRADTALIKTPRPVFPVEPGTVSRVAQLDSAVSRLDVSDEGTAVYAALTGQPGVNLVDRTGSAPRLISRTQDGVPADGDYWKPAISGDGRWVAYYCSATKLVDGVTDGINLFLYDVDQDATSVIARDLTRFPYLYSFRFATVDLSRDGGRVVYESASRNRPQDIYLYERASQTTRRLTNSDYNGDGPSSEPAISANGRFVAHLTSTQLVSSTDYQAHRLDLDAATPADADVVISGPSAASLTLGVAAVQVSDGGVVAYVSAEDSVAGDTNGTDDVYVWRDGNTARVSSLKDGVTRRGGTNPVRLGSIAATAPFSPTPMTDSTETSEWVRTTATTSST